MNRDRNGSEDLMERRGKLIAEILKGMRQLVELSTQKVDRTATIGQMEYNSMAIDIQMNGLIKSVEDLLGLTRQLREMWIAGPLKTFGEGEDEAERLMRADAADVFAMRNQLRIAARQRTALASGGSITYMSAPVDGPPPRLPPQPTIATAATKAAPAP
ncbi:hypothetical protein B0T26DRAFT_751537 [Lasiosphaeria miniovina]|uniref:Uncharacterized protein n=1 Tax=Lasiosphaeria miniovina TaxID=1954250 RepID=A0AA40DYB4_9PEZI|nr:uncharacterized protein B0T26DRAFT_751537 [Lasiosphaeria miniovina]KAK0717486.1 hypothetical protein B0T26DRAFT_751537 [Lasiosphaeria miniovina]